MNEDINERVLAEVICLLGRHAYSGVGAAGLTAAQWSVLRYFSRANSFSRTVSGFADFHATTRGTASQTVKGLVKSGYLGRSRSPLDGRSTRLDLTERAQAALREDPLNDVVEAVGQLSPRERAEVASGLFRVLARLAERRGGKEFGSCTTCGHLKRCEDGDTFRCRYFGAVVEPHELELFCSHFMRDA